MAVSLMILHTCKMFHPVSAVNVTIGGMIRSKVFHLLPFLFHPIFSLWHSTVHNLNHGYQRGLQWPKVHLVYLMLIEMIRILRWNVPEKNEENFNGSSNSFTRNKQHFRAKSSFQFNGLKGEDFEAFTHQMHFKCFLRSM